MSKNKKHKNCEYCTADLKGKRADARFCSDSCRLRWHRAQANPRSIDNVMAAYLGAGSAAERRAITGRLLAYGEQVNAELEALLASGASKRPARSQPADMGAEDFRAAQTILLSMVAIQQEVRRLRSA